MLVDLDDDVYARVLALSRGYDINRALRTYLDWAEKACITPAAKSGPQKYYDTDKYKATSQADAQHAATLNRTSSEDREDR